MHSAYRAKSILMNRRDASDNNGIGTNYPDPTLLLRSIFIPNGHRAHMLFAVEVLVLFRESLCLRTNIIPLIDLGFASDTDPFANLNFAHGIIQRGTEELYFKYKIREVTNQGFFILE